MTSESLLRWLRWHRQELMRLVLISGALFLIAFIAYGLPLRLASLILGGLLAIATAAILLTWPTLGLIALIPASLLVPFEIGTGTESSISPPVVLLVILAGVWLVDMLVIRRRIEIRISPPLLPLTVLVCVACLAWLVGQLPWYPLGQPAPMRAQLGGVAIVVLSALAFFLPGQLIRDLRWLQALTWVFIALGSIFAVGILIAPMRRMLINAYQFGALTSQFWTWLVALTFGQALFNRRLAMPARLLLAALAVVIVYSSATFIANWSSGWIPAAVALVVLLVLRSWWAGLVILVGSPLWVPPLYQQILVTEEYSYSTRTEAWSLIIQITKASPLLGLGPANYYWYTPLMKIREYFGVHYSSHNQYVDLMAQFGLLGLASFLWFAGSVGRLGWQLRSRVPEGFAQAYVYSALAGLAGALAAGALGDWVLPFVYNVGLRGFRASFLGWLFLGGLVALYHLLPDTSPNDSTNA